MRLLVTGGEGMLGRAVLRAAQERGHQALAPGRGELDITDAAALAAAVAQLGPRAIVNCAGFTDVDRAESQPDAAHAVNAVGAGHVARVAAGAGARLVHVSTDYVFAGDSRRPYRESDPPDPRTAYGASKLAGERAVAEAAPGAAVVRTAWLFGAGGRNFVSTMLALGERREAVDVVSDQVGSPTWTGHLAPALLELAEGPAAGACHLAGTGQCSWYELAREAFAVSGLSCQVRPVDTGAVPRPAPRPAFSVLASERPDVPRLPPWREGLRGFLAACGAVAGAAP